MNTVITRTFETDKEALDFMCKFPITHWNSYCNELNGVFVVVLTSRLEA